MEDTSKIREENTDNIASNNICIALLAHVDAGKTTLSESMLYLSGSIRKAGRVDHKDTFLDYDMQERNRGITIYAKQAMFKWNERDVTLLDTPGHIDFSSEMERTLQILDYAIIVVNGLDGIQVHTETIWNLLKHYQIPTFLFVNKMDITTFDKAQLMREIETTLGDSCIDFTQQNEEWLEQLSLCDDALLEEYMTSESISISSIQKAIQQRQVVPCYFGSALKMKGIEEFLNGFVTYTETKRYPSEFGARVFKISRDEQGNKLTHLKITGGSLKAKAKLNETEKVDQIRLYSGEKYQLTNEVYAGQVCAIKGLKNIFVGEGLGIENEAQKAVLTSYLNYKVLLPTGCDVVAMYKNLLQLAQEDPQLQVRFKETLQEITIQLMGEIQLEVLKNKIKERFSIDVEFDQGSVVYKETIAKSVEGVGHYEPLRHYAEVHLLLEPLDRNSGLQFASTCSEDVLPRHWQRLILSHLQEKEQIGVLTGSKITDMRITLLSGRAHLKHTEGGDFRQATYRAVRQGLKEATSELLEPFYEFRLILPREYLSRAMHDLQMRNANYQILSEQQDTVTLSGSAPVSKLQNYQLELHAYTRGKGKLFCTLQGYHLCADADEVIERIAYDSERDMENPTSSVFCAHGAGFVVPWNEVKEHMHIKACWKEPEKETIKPVYHKTMDIDDREVERVMRNIYGAPRERKKVIKKKEHSEKSVVLKKAKPSCFLVDGYNIIHDWDDLRQLAQDNLDAARNKLIHYMSSFQGYKKNLLILVFDAYKVDNIAVQEYYNGSIYIIYTKKAQTADNYIERTTHELADSYDICVATSDGLEQLIVSGQGAKRMSARELRRELDFISKSSIHEYESRQSKAGNRLLEDLRKYDEE